MINVLCVVEIDIYTLHLEIQYVYFVTSGLNYKDALIKIIFNLRLTYSDNMNNITGWKCEPSVIYSGQLIFLQINIF